MSKVIKANVKSCEFNYCLSKSEVMDLYKLFVKWWGK